MHSVQLRTCAVELNAVEVSPLLEWCVSQDKPLRTGL